MKLKTLTVHPNPFLERPIDPNEGKTAVSDVVHTTSAIPSLFETALRLLMTQTPTRRTTLEDMYGYPLSSTWSDALPSHLSKLLNSCLPGCLAAPMTLDTTPRAVRSRPIQRSISTPENDFISICPSPSHRILRDGFSYRRPVYVRHVEERITWEPVIAGVEMTSGSMLSCIPIKWRGCSWGCLDFLSSSDNEGKEKDLMSWDGCEETDVDDDGFEPVVVQFTSEGFEFDD